MPRCRRVCDRLGRGRVGVRALLAALLLSAGTADRLHAQPPAAAEQRTPLDINSASEADLVALKHIGKSKARKILKGRPWKSKDQLVERGILTPGEYQVIKELIVARRP